MSFKKYISDTGYGNDDCRTEAITCECGAGMFKHIYDCSMTETTALWIQCCGCGRKYDVRINLITQKYLEDIDF